MPRERQRAKSDAARAKILDAALEHFSQQGFRSTSMRQIADGAGLSMGNLYHHFPSKETLFEQLLQEFWERILDPDLALNRVFNARDFPDDLERMAAAAEEFVEQNRTHILLIYVDVVEFRGEHIRAFYAGMAERFRGAYGEELEARRARGELGDVDPFFAVMMATRWLIYYFTVEKCFGVEDHLGMDSGRATAEFIRLVRTGLDPRS